MALAQLQHADFVIKNWHTALLSILIITLVAAFNIRGAKQLPSFEKVFIFLHVSCFFIVLITVAVTSRKNDAKEVFLTFSDNGGNYPLSTCRSYGLLWGTFFRRHESSCIFMQRER